MFIMRRPSRGSRAKIALLVVGTALFGLLSVGTAFAAPVRADLVVAMTASPTRIPLTDAVVRVEIDVTNRGSAVADAVTLTVTLPDGIDVSGEVQSGESGWLCETPASAVRCTHPALSPGQSADRVAFSIGPPPGADGDSLRVSARAGTSSRESSTKNNTAAVSITYDEAIVLPPDLYVARTLNVPAHYVLGGQSVRFGIDVGNAGKSTAEGVTLRVTASPKLTSAGVSDWSDPSWRCTGLANPGEFECAHDPLAPGATTGAVQFTAQVAEGAPGEQIPVSYALATTTSGDETSNNTLASGFEYSAAVIRGQVWEDVDGDGQRGPADVPLGPDAIGVTFVPPYGLQVTVNADGTFRAYALPDYQYVEATITDPAMYDFTYPNVGDDATDSDIIHLDYGLGRTAEFYVANGEEVVVDIGLVRLPTAG